MISLPVVQLQLTVGLISWWNFEKKFNLIFFSSVLLIKLHGQSNYFRETLIDLCNQRREISLIYQTQYIVELFFVTEFNHIHVLFLHCHLQVFANTSNCHVLALMMHILNIYIYIYMYVCQCRGYHQGILDLYLYYKTFFRYLSMIVDILKEI